MYTLRCTQKLRSRGLKPSEGAGRAPDTVLGDWYATLLHCRPQQLVLCVSERSLLPVVLPARDARSLPQRLAETVPVMLAALGVPADAIAEEFAAMTDARVGPTASRSVLGSLTQLSYLLEVFQAQNDDHSFLELSLRLAQTPLSALGPDSPFPDRATLAAFDAAAVLARVRSLPEI